MTTQELARTRFVPSRHDSDARLHTAFHVSLILKALSAALETIAGLALMIITPDQLHAVALALINAVTTPSVGVHLTSMLDITSKGSWPMD